MKKSLLMVAMAAAAAVAQEVPPPPQAMEEVKAAAKPPVAVKPAAAPSYKDLKYPALKPIAIPKVETATLANGMKLYLLEDHELPVIGGTARIRTGNLFDPPDKVGLAVMTGMVMRTGGTRTKTGEQLDEELENIAASVESAIDETYGSVSFSALKENSVEVMGVFRDVLTSPEFRPDKMELARTQLSSGIARRNDDPNEILQRQYTDILYGHDTPYGWDLGYATINRITRADLQRFYNRYFFPKNAILAVWGDFDAVEMKARIEKLFADWTVEQPPVPAFPAVTGKSAPGMFLAVKKDVKQTYIAIGHLGGELKDKDFPALEIMADILGGGFQSRLVKRIRTKMGDAYEIGASWGVQYDHPGLFEISGSTKPQATVEVIRAVEEELGRIRVREVSEEELKTAKDTALNSMVFAYDTKTKTLGRLLTYEYYGYPKDFIQQYQKALAAVTRADVLRVAKEHLKPEGFNFVVVGNPADFGTPLESLVSQVTPIDLTIPGPKVEAAAGDAVTLESGKQILGRAQQAAGGLDKLAAVKDLTQSAEFRLDAAAGGLRVKETDRWVAPTSFRQDSEVPAGKIAAYFDGKYGWIATPQGSGPLSGTQLKQVQGDLFRLYFRTLQSDRIEGRTVNAVDEHTVEIGEEGQVARLTFDRATGLLQTVQYESAQVAGPPISVLETYSDFREVGGLKVPFQIQISQGGRKFADVTVTDCQLNTGLKVADLEKRP